MEAIVRHRAGPRGLEDTINPPPPVVAAARVPLAARLKYALPDDLPLKPPVEDP
jgi:hypothetical protein